VASASVQSRVTAEQVAESPRAASVRPSVAVVWLAALIGVLSLIAAGVGLLWGGGSGSVPFTTLRGETVQLYGQGLYRHDTLLNGPGYKGMDGFVLVVGVPLLAVCTLLYRRGSLRGGLLLTGTLGYFLYNTASMTFNYAYNDLFLVYIALFSASLFATVLAFASIDPLALRDRCAIGVPRSGIAVFLFAVGAALAGVWLGLSIAPALLRGEAPAELASYTTLVTHALDMGIIAPLAIVAGVLLLRRAALGYLLAAVLLILSSVLGVGLLIYSAAQVIAGVLSTGQFIGFVVPFIILTVAGVWLTVSLFRGIAEEMPGVSPAASQRVRGAAWS
jgi:hypothetical protein